MTHPNQFPISRVGALVMELVDRDVLDPHLRIFLSILLLSTKLKSLLW